MKKLSKQITLGYDPYTGKRIRTRVYGASKAALAQAEKDALREFAKSNSITSITFGKYRDKWFEANCTTVSPRTQEYYRGLLKKLEPLENMRMSRITRLDLQKIINDNWEHPTSCKRIAMISGWIWRSAVIDGAVDKNIAEGLKTPKKPKSERQALSQAELEGIRKADFDGQEQFLVDVLLQFGLRPGEAFALSPRSFNRKTRTLRIDKAVSYTGGQPFIKSTKTDVIRDLPVPDSFWQKIPKTKGMYFFVNDEGKLFTRSEAGSLAARIIGKINKAMGGSKTVKATHMSLYTFRHNKASLLYYMPGISLKKKAEYMGHSEKMFLQTYSHLMEGKEDTEMLRQEVM